MSFAHTNAGAAGILGIQAGEDINEVPDDIDWYIEDNDGREVVAEKHRKWGAGPAAGETSMWESGRRVCERQAT